MIALRSRILVLALALVVAQATRSETNERDILIEAKHLLREGNVLNDTTLILKGYGLLMSAYRKAPSAELLYFVAQAEYELVRLGVTDRKNRLYEKYIDAALEKAEAVAELREEWSEAYALISSLHGYRIAYNPLNAVTAGPKSFSAAEEAVKRDSTNPRAWLVRGIVRLNMPSIFGGSKTEAVKSFTRAIALFEQNTSVGPHVPDWGYLDACVWLGWALQELKQEQDAKLSYEKALAIEPRANWIREFFLGPLEERLESTAASEKADD